MIVLVCGSRFWTDGKFIRKILQKYQEDCSIEAVVEGEAFGADKLAREAAESLRIPVRPFPAIWHQYGKAAGPIRNQQMLDEGKPDMVLAFHDNLHQSKGTADMLRRARRREITVRIYRHRKVT